MKLPRHLLSLIVICLACASAAWASPTSPDLELEEASLIDLGSARQLRVEGSFHYEDLVQTAYPFQLMIYTAGGHYVRFDLSGNAYSGVAPSIGNGISVPEATLLLTSGVEAHDAAVVAITQEALELRLPESLPREPLSVQIFVEDQGRVIFSNLRAVDGGQQP